MLIDDALDLERWESPVDTPEALREAVVAIAEEYAQLGYAEEEILGFFKNRACGPAHAAFTALGEPAVIPLVHEAVLPWAVVHRRGKARRPRRSPVVADPSGPR